MAAQKTGRQAARLAVLLCELAGCGLGLKGVGPFVEPRPFTLRPSHECWQPSVPAPPSYDVVVNIAVGQNQKRVAAQRDTWAKQPAAGTRCSILMLFVYAAPAAECSHTQNGDEVVLHLNTSDEYERLPAKVIGSFQWMSRHVAYKYVFKTDDDAWVCMHELLRTIAPMPRARLYWGKMNVRHALIDATTHRGFVHTSFSRYFGGATHYRTYAFGAAYVLSADVVEAIADDDGVDAAAHVQIEDVLVGELIYRRLLGRVFVRNARNHSISLGYSRQRRSADSPKLKNKASVKYLLHICAPARVGGKGSIVVHRIWPRQVRLCAEQARGHCPCDNSRRGLCSGLAPATPEDGAATAVVPAKPPAAVASSASSGSASAIGGATPPAGDDPPAAATGSYFYFAL